MGSPLLFFIDRGGSSRSSCPRCAHHEPERFQIGATSRWSAGRPSHSPLVMTASQPRHLKTRHGQSATCVQDPCTSIGRSPSAILRVWVVEAAARIPGGALVAMDRDPARILQHACQVQEIPRHEGGVAIGEIVFKPARALVEVGRAWTGLADPPGVGLRRNDVAQVLERIQDVHGAVLTPSSLPVTRQPATPP